MGSTVFSFLLSGWLCAAILMVLAWVIQRRIQNAAVVDVAWCAGFVLVCAGLALATTGDPIRRVVVAIMVGVWGLRLSGYVLFNRVIGRSEDPRYARLRRQWGKRAPVYLFLLFQAEALAFPVFVLPVIVLMENSQPRVSPWEWVGLLVWAVAMAGEWTADRQLAAFRARPENKGRTFREGLWRYSRHPNYFFESLHWWAYVLMGIGVPYGWLTLLAPVAMTVSLLKISGIPLAESQAVVDRGDEYRDYQRTTSPFIPWFPKENNR